MSNIYSQNNPAWKNAALGFDSPDRNSPSYGTIGQYGCYVTAIANVCNWAGMNLNPQQINDMCKQNGWFTRSDLISNDAIPANLCSNLQYAGKTVWRDATPMDFFSDANDPTVCYIICIDASPAAGIQTHFVMVWGTLGNDLEIDDSWDGIRRPLSHYGNPAVIIQSATKFIKNQPAPLPPYSTEAMAPHRLQLTQASSKWDCNRTDFEDRRTHPISEFPAGYDFVANATYTTLDGNRYYVDDVQNSGGFHIGDCTDYVAPVVPYVPPTAPVKGTPAERYTLHTTLMTFPTANDAQFSTNAQQTLRPKKYYVWNKQDKIYQLGEDNSHEPVGNWVNTKFNVREVPKSVKVEPKPVTVLHKPSDVKVGTQEDNAWKSSYKRFYADHHSDLYEAKQYLTMTDYSGKRAPVAIQPGNKLLVTGTFLKDGVMFYRTRSSRDEFFSWYFGIPLYDDNGSINLVKVVDTTPKPTLKNILYWVADDLRRWWDIKTNKEIK